MTLSLEMIRAARERIRNAVYHSPCPYSLSLSKLCGAEIYCKLDHLQMTGSFKERGARNKLMQLTDEQKRKGVITASAGNHGMGVAYHGQLLNIPVTVVMSKFAPLVKVQNCRGFGAEVILEGDSLADAKALADRLANERGLTYIQGFDDEQIMAGAGSLGLEILEDVPDLDALLVPVGGGGMIGAIGTVIKALKPAVRVIGVEPVHAPKLSAAMAAGKVVEVDVRPTLADGLGVNKIGTLCFEIARHTVEKVVTVEETAIAKAILRLMELEKMVVEGAGAVGLAAMMERDRLGLTDLKGKKVVLVLCGGNIDVTTLGRVIDRGMASDGRLTRITADISERPGTLANVLNVIAKTGGSMKDVRLDHHFGVADPALVRVFLVVETRDFGHAAEVRQALRDAGFQVRD
ncbi:MAG TPA: threonine ammonia-lyase [Phycisphaerae bacterium]|nr:threonine ammonia-lyase [Phycisphaerae bacterium]